MAPELTATSDTLSVSEVFGPTIQGEGPTCGRPASFIRLGGCNLTCTWCDTSYTWDARRHDLRQELRRRPVGALLDEALSHSTPIVVITGGEPLLHQPQPAWGRLLAGLSAAGRQVEVETNGTIAPSGLTGRLATRFNVSPKLTHAGGRADRRIRPGALRALHATGKAVFKFVCGEPADLREAEEAARQAGIPPDLVWIMPEGTDPAVLIARMKALAGPATEAGYNLTTRMHILLWGDERGR
jgi:organic radical activating enzyme